MPIFVALVLNKNHFGTYLNRLATITTTHVPKYYRITPRKSAERRPFLEPHSSRFPTAVSCLKNRGGGGCVGGGQISHYVPPRHRNAVTGDVKLGHRTYY